MGLGKSIEKLDDYYGRLERGKVEKIKSAHVEKVIAKLHSKEKALKSDLAECSKDSKKKRLKSKLSIVSEQLERANWLLKKVQ
ncbi:hypothetical protein [Roseibium sp.]|uniref:hypothetical protein n=1 Tax=Roseibium sp. TaxID=1936156 RepID=UPI003B51732A